MILANVGPACLGNSPAEIVPPVESNRSCHNVILRVLFGIMIHWGATSWSQPAPGDPCGIIKGFDLGPELFKDFVFEKWV